MVVVSVMERCPFHTEAHCGPTAVDVLPRHSGGLAHGLLVAVGSS